jgi:FtsZ-interacting cell division protein ZipA
MNSQVVILLVVIAAIAIAAVIFFAARKRRSQNLREQFGPEYDRVVKKEGDVHKGEQTLEFRQKHRKTLEIRPLSAADQNRFSSRWNEVQNQFVDNPSDAVAQADGLITEVMEARGYPTSDFTQQAADISVDHPVVVENYRAAHDIAGRRSRGQAGTEDLRQAMVHYRALFTELVEERQPEKLRRA